MNVIAVYSANVSRHPSVSAIQKGRPWRSITGIARNIGSDGRTYQKVAAECAAGSQAEARRDDDRLD
ncbi:hypothetical protein [Sphingomonas melonis]|jgi:hypothetical protein|uniref:hypothetical protein n=1 Tax=Sphingomonas melonis TaxID=152682 RepID=UPI001C8C0220